MSKKQWFELEIECIKYNSSCTCEIGDKWTVAKVKSYGLAFAIAEQYLNTVYKPEYFKINIK